MQCLNLRFAKDYSRGVYAIMFALYMNNSEIFTPEEHDENEERKRKLIELVASGEAVLIVGAGSSAPCRLSYLERTPEGIEKFSL